MIIHKSTRLTPIQRKEVADRCFHQRVRIAALARDYRISRNSIYHILRRAGVKDYAIHKSINHRYRCLQYGIKRLSKVEAALEKKLKAQALRCHKNYPGEMMHSDATELPVLEGEKLTEQPETPYIAIDDYSRELYAAIPPDRTQYSSTAFLAQVLEECPYTIEFWYTDNGTEYMRSKRHSTVIHQTAYSTNQRQGRTSHQDHTGYAAEENSIYLKDSSKTGTH